MKFTFEWLKEFLETEANLDIILSTLTDIGLEVEEVVDSKSKLRDFVVVKILNFTPHPNADTLNICEVDDGRTTHQIVCGASNVKQNLVTIMAPIGSIIPSNGMKIKQSTIRGIESNGMLCAASELSLTSYIDNGVDGILDLDSSLLLGSKLIDLKEFSSELETVIDIAITPNRGDCLGVYGIARELMTAGLGELKPLPVFNEEITDHETVDIQIKDPDCQQFSGRLISEVKNTQSPSWLAQRLMLVGITPRSAIVDITNYMAYSFARPMHAFDYDSINNNQIIIQSNPSTARVKMLNDLEYELDSSCLIVSDNQKQVLALSGIIGSESSATQLNSNIIFLESALFSPTRISSTGRKLNIHTDARYRFERGSDPELIVYCLQYASSLVLELCGGKLGAIHTEINSLPSKKEVKLTLQKLKKLTSIDFDRVEISVILENLGFKIHELNDDFLITEVPSWRNDIAIEEDVIEEIIRIHGINNITPQPLHKTPNDKNLPISSHDIYKKINIIKLKKFCALQGAHEIISWSFISDQLIDIFQFDQSQTISVINPINRELNIMRPSLIPNIIKHIRNNQCHNIFNAPIFEVGKIYNDINPNGQEEYIAGSLTGDFREKTIHNNRTYNVHDIKKTLFNILDFLGINCSRLTLQTNNCPSYYHPGRSAQIYLGKVSFGYFGEIHPHISKHYELNERSYIYELNLNKLSQFISNKTKSYTKPPYNPSNLQTVTRDISIIIDKNILAIDIINLLHKTKFSYPITTRIIDIYNLEDHAKNSITITINIQQFSDSLTSDQINNLINDILLLLKQKFNAYIKES